MDKIEGLAGRENRENREKALNMALLTIEKQFGKGSIMKLGEGRKLAQEMGVISTGCLSLDLAMGIGGLPRGRVTEIYGPESSGKTTIALYCIAQAQKEGGVAAFIDAEHALDVTYATKLGVNVEELLISQPDTGEQALEIAEILVRSGGIDVVVVDSVAALVPRAELEGEMGDAHMGLQARLMSQALRKLTGCISKSKTCVIFINQLRMKLGIMFGNPETTTGGNALKFYASARLDIRRVSALKNGEDVVGSRTRIKVVKNKMAPPFKQVEFDILFGEGISKEGDLIDLGQQYQIIEKSGAWFSFEGERLGQGRDNTRVFLKEHPEITEKIRRAIEVKLAKDGLYPSIARINEHSLTDGDGAHGAGKEQCRDKTARQAPVRANPKKSD
ncbi:MAG: recombinase RecA [Deltaproteobacteria bacterium]|nr:recombinase RecA [Deltaproteobacteria bacterium]